MYITKGRTNKIKILKEFELFEEAINEWVILDTRQFRWYGLNLEKHFIAMTIEGKFRVFEKEDFCIELKDIFAVFDTLKEAVEYVKEHERGE